MPKKTALGLGKKLNRKQKLTGLVASMVLLSAAGYFIVGRSKAASCIETYLYPKGRPSNFRAYSTALPDLGPEGSVLGDALPDTANGEHVAFAIKNGCKEDIYIPAIPYSIHERQTDAPIVPGPPDIGHYDVVTMIPGQTRVYLWDQSIATTDDAKRQVNCVPPSQFPNVRLLPPEVYGPLHSFLRTLPVTPSNYTRDNYYLVCVIGKGQAGRVKDAYAPPGVYELRIYGHNIFLMPWSLYSLSSPIPFQLVSEL